MTRIMYARIALALIAIAVLGYGINTDQPRLRIAAMSILALSLILRFFPPSWLNEKDKQ